MMIELERIVLEEKAGCCDGLWRYKLYIGGAGCNKLQIAVAHIESRGVYNREMPEEINRVLTDHVSSWLFTPEPKPLKI